MEKTRIIQCFCTKEQWLQAYIHNLDIEGDNLVFNGSRASVGFVCFPIIDSLEKGFKWTRAFIKGHFPKDTTIAIRAIVSDEDIDSESILSKLETSEEPLLKARQYFGNVISESEDFLINSEGRFLFLMIEFGNANGHKAKISSLNIQLVSDHMIDYLPAIYSGDDFTYRFLSIYDSLISDLEQKIDTISSELDIKQAGDEMFSCIANWINLEPSGSRKAMEDRLSTALNDYETMFTYEGVVKTIKSLTGKDAIVIEGSDIDSNNQIDQAQAEYFRKMYADDPYRLFILLEDGTFKSLKQREDFVRKIKNYIPAGIEVELIMLRKGVQLGWHTYLGVNTAILDSTTAQISDNIGFDIDTRIGGDQ